VEVEAVYRELDLTYGLISGDDSQKFAFWLGKQ
jgi:hypothetical protein